MSADRTVSLHVPKAALWLFGLLLIAPWGLLLIGPRSQRSATVAPTVAPAPNGAALQAQPGPWGQLEVSRLMIEAPEEFISPEATQAQLTPWFFKGYTDAAVNALFQSAGLSAEQLAFVQAAAHREVKPDGVVVHPDREFILGLNPASRGKLYAVLGETPENVPQYNPFRLRTSAAAGWLDDAGLPANVVELTKRLMYSRGTATCFSDEALVLPLLATPDARVTYLKALSRKSGLIVQLRVGAGQNIDALAEYWGRGGRSKDLRPLLQSLARRPTGGSIDIVHLLPRFARLLIYTYPLPSERPVDANHDCHWTSFNFQNDQPDERFADINYVRQVLFDQYYPVVGAPTLGDIIMFVRKDGVVVHSCVYIADDIVFTKNGPAYSVPWLLSSLADVQAFYSENAGVEMRRYRAKKL